MEDCSWLSALLVVSNVYTRIQVARKLYIEKTMINNSVICTAQKKKYSIYSNILLSKNILFITFIFVFRNTVKSLFLVGNYLQFKLVVESRVE